MQQLVLLTLLTCTALAQQCILQTPSRFGPVNNGTNFSDYTTLTQASNQAVLYLSEIKLCQTDNL